MDRSDPQRSPDPHQFNDENYELFNYIKNEPLNDPNIIMKKIMAMPWHIWTKSSNIRTANSLLRRWQCVQT